MNLSEREQKRASSPVGAMLGIEAEKPEQTEKEKKRKGEKEGLIQRGYYLTPSVAAQVKINAAMTGRRDYQVVQEALELYFKDRPTE
ncbi:hypothetical protein LK537_27445 [Lachnoclostridium pacaense]|uniref:hypothetical protein n=1 Tax=Enterocloster hominis (ex Hitch et al. 2024) TaxID=1917870 RepID=UPI001D0F874D|nr:hypothetical protein [Lachnoclostridium pacaense]MCC2821035.1 hypothetical protein [Lachnoclostridium pacaense]